MAILTPNETYTVNGVTVREKIIPDGTRWKDSAKAEKAGFSANALYKKQQKLSGNTGKVKSVTIHNTGDLANVDDDAEQYTRATYNENMKSARVHFYVDDLGAWQNLMAGTGMAKIDPLGSAEVSWHAGDGSVADGGNMTSMSIEIIMNDNQEHDAQARDNGARLAAWLLWKHELGINCLVTHTYWVNKTAGKQFADADEQCTNYIKGKKWCPTYIFGSTNHSVALANWKAFKALTEQYLKQLSSTDHTEDRIPEETIEADNKDFVEQGDLVSLKENAVYYSGKTIPSWVKGQNWYVKQVTGNRAVIDSNEKGTNAICSPVDIKYLTVVRKAEKENPIQTFQSYLVKITTDQLNIRQGAGTNYAVVGCIKDRGVYTIVAESSGQGASKWGKLKSGTGWISLDYAKRV